MDSPGARIVTGPAWAHSVGAMIATDVRVTAFCSRCGGTWRKDRAWLERLAAERGPEFSLWNLRPHCWTPNCPDRMFFRASCAEGTPSIRLEDRGLKTRR